MSCTYTYKGKEYTSKESLAEQMREDILLSEPRKTFRIADEMQKIILEEETIEAFGTDEILSFTQNEDGSYNVTIDVNKDVKDEVIDVANNIIKNPIFNSAKKQEDNIKARLVSFANKLGINVTTLENFSKERGIDERGIIDLMERVIAVATNDKDNSILTEEVSHLAIEYNLDQNIVSKMLDKINETDAYRQYAETYRNKYSQEEGKTKEQVERKVRKEILGKILAERIKLQFKTEDATNSKEIGIFTQLKNLWNRFLELFKNRDNNFYKEFGKIIDDIATNVVQGDISKFAIVDSKEVYYSLSMEEKSTVDRLKDIAESLNRGYRNVVNESSQTRQARQMKMADITSALSVNEYARAITIMSSIIAQDVRNAKIVIENAKDINGNVDSNKIPYNDVANLKINSDNFESYAKILLDEIKGLEKEKVLTPKEAVYLKTSIQNTLKDFTKIKIELDSSVIEDKVRDVMEEVLDDFSANKTTKDYFLKFLRKPVMEDIWGITKYVGNINKTDNPILSTIYAMFVKASRTTARIAEKEFFRLANILDENSGAKPMVEKLKVRGDMIASVRTHDFEEFIEKGKQDIIDEYSTKLTGNTEKDAPILIERNKKIEEFIEANIEREFTKEFYDKLKDYSQEAKSVIITRAIEKNKIYSKYNYNSNIITQGDLTKIQQIDSQYQLAKSEYYPDGTRKFGLELQVAQELNKYSKSFSGVEITEDARNAFETERLKIKNLYGETSSAYKNWMSMYSTVTYTQEDFDEFESNIDEELTEEALGEDFKKTLIDSLGMSKNSSITDIYEKLIDKRRQMLAPYKIVGETGEINAELVEADTDLMLGLQELYAVLDMFVKIPSADLEIKIESKGNKQFQKEWLKTENDTRARSELVRKAGVRKINGKYVPTVYHYRTFDILRGEAKVNKTIVPSPRFLQQDKQYVNPRFNQNLKGKTLQPKDRETWKNKEFFDMFGIDDRTDFWGEKGATRNMDLYTVRQSMLDSKYESDRKYKLENSNNYFRLPQKYGAIKEIFAYDDREGALKGVVAREFLVDSAEEGDFGDSDRMTIPKRYTQRGEQGEGAISKDLLSLYAHYFYEAENYKNKSLILPQAQILKYKIENSAVGESRDGKSSNILKMVENFYSEHLYGNKLKEIKTFSAFGKTVSASKVVKSVYGYMVKTNLAFSPVTPVVGLISSTAYGIVESASGGMITKDSTTWATKEFGKLIASDYVLDTGAYNPQSKLRKLQIFSGIDAQYSQLVEGTDKGRAYRTADNLGFKPYEITAIPTGAMSMLTIFDSYRLVDGKFINRLQYKEIKGSEEGWEAYRQESFYNYLKEKSDGTLYIDNSENKIKENLDTLYARITTVAVQMHDSVEGKQNQLDRAAIMRYPVLAFLGMHKGWFWNYIQRSFKQGNFNLVSGQYEEGNYLTAQRLFWNLIKDRNSTPMEKFKNIMDIFGGAMSLGAYSRGLENLEEYEKSNIIRMAADVYVFTTLLALFLLAQAGADDDEEDWTKQYLAYISTRALAEQASVTFPTTVSESLAIIKSPVAGVNLVESLLGIGDIFSSEIITSGNYKGDTKGKRAFMKLFFIKNLYVPMNNTYKDSNRMMRTDLGFANKLYKLMKEDEE